MLLFTWAMLVLTNWIFQIMQKPSEIIGLADSHFNKTPAETWTAYKPLFRKHSTELIRPELLAALAQLESQGNPIARTYWTWNWSLNPFEVYAPASSSVGMLQMTNGTYNVARRFCIHNGQVVREGKWYNVRSCWFNGVYNRLIPTHAIEMTAAYLHTTTAALLKNYPGKFLGVMQQQDVPAIVHLCGRQRAETILLRDVFSVSGEKCGTHAIESYLKRINKYRATFKRYSELGSPQSE